MKIKDFEIIDHGYCHSDYFQGCGTSFTMYDECVTGVGSNAKEAYESAVEQLYSSFDIEPSMPTRPKGIRVRDKIPAALNTECSDLYWYVSIRVQFKK